MNANLQTNLVGRKTKIRIMPQTLGGSWGESEGGEIVAAFLNEHSKPEFLVAEGNRVVLRTSHELNLADGKL